MRAHGESRSHRPRISVVRVSIVRVRNHPPRSVCASTPRARAVPSALGVPDLTVNRFRNLHSRRKRTVARALAHSVHSQCLVCFFAITFAACTCVADRARTPRSHSPSPPARVRVSASPRARRTRDKNYPRTIHRLERRASVLEDVARAPFKKVPSRARLLAPASSRGRVVASSRRRLAPFDRIACTNSHRPPGSISARRRPRTRRTPLASPRGAV